MGLQLMGKKTLLCVLLLDVDVEQNILSNTITHLMALVLKHI